MTNIYVGNLSYDATEDDLRQAFSAHGEVTSVSVITDRETGRPRGFAFVEMSNAEEAEKAIQAINDQDIAGRPTRSTRPQKTVTARKMVIIFMANAGCGRSTPAYAS